MSIESTYDKFISLNKTIGKRALNALYPDEVELYIFALELINSSGDTEDYFVFPINPSSINEQYHPIKSVTKTAGGVTVLKTTTFSPTDISIQGNFGRQFKILLGKEVISFSALKFKGNTPTPSFSAEFDPKIKTGFGCYKSLENIIKKSNTLDNLDSPYSLIFYNLALGNSYLVEAMSLAPYQNLEMNMIWSYNLTLKSLLPVEEISSVSERSMTQSLSVNQAIQGAVNNIANNVAKLLKL